MLFWIRRRRGSRDPSPWLGAERFVLFLRRFLDFDLVSVALAEFGRGVLGRKADFRSEEDLIFN